MYKELKSQDLKLNDNQSAYNILSSDGSAGGFFYSLAEDFKGYAVIERNPKTGKYFIAEIHLKDLK